MRSLLLVFLLLFQDLFIGLLGKSFWLMIALLMIFFVTLNLKAIRLRKTPIYLLSTVSLILLLRALSNSIELKNFLQEFVLYLIIPIAYHSVSQLKDQRIKKYFFFLFLIFSTGIVYEFFTGFFDRYQRYAVERNFFLIGSPSNIFIYSFGLIILSDIQSKSLFKKSIQIVISYLSKSRFPLLASLLVLPKKIKRSLYIIIGLILVLIISLNLTAILSDSGNLGRIKYWGYLFNEYNPTFIEFLLGKGIGFISQNPILDSIHMESSFIKIFIEGGILGILIIIYVYSLLMKNLHHSYVKIYFSIIFIHAIVAPLFPSIGNFMMIGLVRKQIE